MKNLFANCFLKNAEIELKTEFFVKNEFFEGFFRGFYGVFELRKKHAFCQKLTGISH
jgi:hypothetical protein